MARTGGAQVFFDVLATFNAKRLLQDTKTINTMMKAAYLDTINTLTGEFQALGQMVDEFTDEVIASSRAFEEARIDFEKFVNVSDELQGILPQMVDDIVAIGEGFAFTGEEALKAASRMAQMGAVIGKSTIETGTEIGVMFGLISGMETDAAMRRLTNLMQQTGFHMATNLEKTNKLTAAQFNNLTTIEKQNMFYNNSIEVLNQLNTVENRSIATMEQLTYTMNQFASQAALTGSSIAEMAAMSATLIEAGEQQGAAGRALRHMYARLGGDIAGAREEMQAMGIEIVNEEGNMKTLLEVMTDLKAKGWDELTGIQQQNIAQTISGNRHYVRFIKMMEGLHRITELTEGSLHDFDSAQEEVDRRLETTTVTLEGLEAQLENVNAAIGTALLPGMIAGKETVLMWNQELEKFVSGDYGESFSDLANTMVRLREGFGIVGPFVQMMIIVRGLTVAFGTMRSVIAGMKGEAIALNRQYHKSTALMDITRQTTMQMKNEHKSILDTMGRINELKLFAANNEKQIEIATQRQEQHQKTILATYLSMNEVEKQQYIQGELRIQQEQKLAEMAEKIKGNAFSRLNILEMEVEMTQRLQALQMSAQQRNLIPGAAGGARVGPHSLMDPRAAADMMRQRTEGLMGMVRTRTALADSATLQQNITHELTEQLTKMGVIKTNQLGRVELTKLENGEHSKYVKNLFSRFQEEVKILGAKQNQLKTTEDQIYRQRGLISHLDTIVVKHDAYNEMIKESQQLHQQLLDFIEQESHTQEELIFLQGIYGEALKEDLTLLHGKSEEIKEQLLLAEQELIHQQQYLKGLQNEQNIRNGILTSSQKTAVFAQGMAGASGKTLHSLSMALPIVGAMTQNTSAMRMGMMAMHLSMVSMLGPMVKSAAQTGLILFNLQATNVQLTAMELKMQRIAAVGKTVGLVLTVGAFFVADWWAGKNAKAADEYQKKLQKINEEMLRFEETVQRLTTTEPAKIFSDMHDGLVQAFPELTAINHTMQEIYGSQEVGESVVAGIEAALARPGLRDDMALALEDNLTAAMLALDVAKLRDAAAQGVEPAFGPDSPLYQMVTGEMLEEAIKEGWKPSEDLNLLRVKPENIHKHLLMDMQRTGQFMEYMSEGLLNATADMFMFAESIDDTSEGLNTITDEVSNLTEEIYKFSGAREELFFGGQYGNVTGSLYRQVVQQGVGTLYHKNEVIMSNNFHGFFNEEEAATRIIDILNDYFAER